MINFLLTDARTLVEKVWTRVEFNTRQDKEKAIDFIDDNPKYRDSISTTDMGDEVGYTAYSQRVVDELIADLKRHGVRFDLVTQPNGI